MKYLRIFWSLTRYRVAVMLALFMAIAMARHNGFDVLRWQYLLALFALVCNYVSATSFNDLADEAIDKINHAGRPGRLLVTGEATRRQLAAVGIFASILMVASGAVFGPLGALLMLASLAINVVYSFPPLQLSHRTFVVPFVLPIGYVVIPYSLGLVLVNAPFTPSDSLFLAALYILFVARINLKDFRDRAGDSKFGKPTFLLRYGKSNTIMVSQATLWLGILLATVAAMEVNPLGVSVLIYGAISSWLLFRLSQTPEGLNELVIIGVAAQIGNGLLLTLLGVFLLTGPQSPAWLLYLVLLMVLVGSLGNLKFLSQDPHRALEAYRG